MNYRLVESGDILRREYFSLNRSPLFKDLPKGLVEVQIKSYEELLQNLYKLFDFYFPVEFSNYNNDINCFVKSLRFQEPLISEEEAKKTSSTWNYEIFSNWVFSWNCHKIQIPLISEIILENVEAWVEKSFKIGKFDIFEKQNEWLIKEKKGNLSLNIQLIEKQENNLIVKFTCKEEKEISICKLPKINARGNFLINGHEKVVIFQSIRAPSVYYFKDEEDYYCEIIPTKGPWINISRNKKNPTSLDLKFLNSGLSFDILSFFKAHGIEKHTLEQIFDPSDLDLSNYPEIKKLEISSFPQFLFNKKNSYFIFGELGRKKFNLKSNLFRQVKNLVLAEDIFSLNGKIILPEGTLMDDEKISALSDELNRGNFSPLDLPFSNYPLFLLKVYSPNSNEKEIINLIGYNGNITEEKLYFDLADLLCASNIYFNIYKGVNFVVEDSEAKDRLENQVLRSVGNLILNIFDNKLGSLIQNISNKYLAYLSQFKKTDLAKLPNIKDFDNLLRNFFNTSSLVQLQNQNNPLAEYSYTKKTSTFGLGGFTSPNTTIGARNINSSHYGCYDLVETPEGQRVGLIHNLTISATINKYGQIAAPYFRVEKGVVKPGLVYLTSEEQFDYYISHCNIAINEENEITTTEKILVRFQNNFVWVTSNEVNYIDSSFYHLNSITSANIPFFSFNDATRNLMASNMQRQAVTLLESQSPLVDTGMGNILAKSSSLAIKAEEDGEVEYVDSKKIVIRGNGKDNVRSYYLKQLENTNKNILNFSSPLVRKSQKVSKGQIIANGTYTKDGEYAIGTNLRVAYLLFEGFGFEDAFAIKDSVPLTSLSAKCYVSVRRNTKNGEELFSSKIPYQENRDFSHLDKDGIVKIGTKVQEGTILVGKITPEVNLEEESEEANLLLSILGEKSRKFSNTSLYMPAGENGIVYNIERIIPEKNNKKQLEIVKVYVARERKIAPGDKLTTRFGNKGVVAKILPEVDMPYDEEGKPFDIIFNPLSVPSRMNVGQLLETVLAKAAHKLGIKILVRPFNAPSLTSIKEIMKEASIDELGEVNVFDGRTGLKLGKCFSGIIYTMKLNHMASDKFHARNTGPYSLFSQQATKGRLGNGGQRIGEMEAWVFESFGNEEGSHILLESMGLRSDDIHGRRELQRNIIFDNNQSFNLENIKSESLNVIIQYLRAIGFNIQAFDKDDKEIDFYKYFSKE